MNPASSRLRITQGLLLSLLLSLASAPAQSQDATPLSAPYRKWLHEDARWIITVLERTQFEQLKTDQQRDTFIISFWESRNPDRGAAVNKFKEEHYRRLAFANSNFASRVPGYETDRGQYYVVYGAPDSVDSLPGTSPPSEVWHYRHLKGVVDDITLRFVDRCGCGDYRATTGSIPAK
jgi:GWxTD domain-containing protein